MGGGFVLVEAGFVLWVYVSGWGGCAAIGVGTGLLMAGAGIAGRVPD